MGRAGLALLVAVLAGCALDRAGIGRPGTDGGPDIDAYVTDADVSIDAGPPDARSGPLLVGEGVFSRASSATYVDESGRVVAVEPNVPRERVVGGVVVRWIEGSTTNLVLQSESQSGAPWGASPAAVGEDSALAPDGTMTADRVTFAAGQFGPFQRVATSPATLTLSIWVRAVSAPATFRARYSWDRAGASVRVSGTATDAWTRAIGVATSAGPQDEAVALEGRADIPDADDPALAQDVEVWGWQLEARPFASSYVRSGGTPAVRDADSWTFGAEAVSSQFASAPATITIVPEWSSLERTTDAWVFAKGEDGIRIRSGGFFDVVSAGTTAVTIGPVAFAAGDVVEIQYDPAAGNLSVRVQTAELLTAGGSTWTWSAGPLRLGGGTAAETELFGWVSAPR